ncbi:uncharacterized protein TRUGW13939_05428 [Talaromyces rugulosus]|uniref:DOMON domain-containing protein n=1 Tax=Talaromyces rugulosus TaxID=121627 RepID=A0A7H8QWZ0_TALRU|nr:uncharacterized protein TRUGW13939_05428 [Talaromyces rugulosus]QKX58306.1 hypothetical protein TRUGW13939_05428 [Talaromyces rugulosus]
MFFNILTCLACTLLSLVISSSAFVSRSTPSAGEEFSLYAYGDSVGGLPLFYSDGKAAVGILSSSNSSASNVTFERTSDSSTGSLVGNPPNGTSASSANSSWSDQFLYIPSSSSSSNEIGFTSESGDNATTTKFVFYGQTLLVKDESGDIVSSFYARQSSSEGGGVYSLLWNVTEDHDAVFPVSLRTVAASNA